MPLSRLWIREPSGAVREHPLDGAERSPPGIVIGRDADSDIVLDDPAVSRKHARLVPHEGGWKLVDLRSANRTFVNGDPIQETILSPGDRIGIGDCELHLVGEVQQVAGDASRTQVLTRLAEERSPRGSGDRAAHLLAALYDLGQKLAVPGRPMELLDRAIQLVTEKLGADRGAVLLFEEDALVCRAAHSQQGQALRGFVLSQTIYREVMQTRAAVLSRDTQDDRRFRDQASIVGEEIRTIIAAPMRHGEQMLGILYLDRVERQGNPFQSEDLYGAAVAAEILAAALASRSAVEGLENEREVLVRTIIENHPIVGMSPAIQKVREFIRRAAAVSSTVLILGETGTGKELVARATHYQSRRSGAPFVAINCAAIAVTLVESELFGHEKGAFTGAVERKSGKFEVADRGTVFLDEIAELPLGCQSKLLRLLEERCFERVGGTRSVTVDVRIIAATNRDLAAEVDAGRFRADLYYRLNVLPIEMPPLRARREDLPILVEHILDEFARAVGARRKTISTEALARLAEEPWPGNVRQLRNVLESCVVLSDRETIEVGDLPLGMGTAGGGRRAAAAAWEPRKIEDVDRDHIARVLEHVGWNKSRAAEILGIERSTLYARIKEYGLKQEGAG